MKLPLRNSNTVLKCKDELRQLK